MHIPPIFAEQRPEALHKTIRDYPLATLVTITGRGQGANLLPLEISKSGDQLRGHVARSHPLALEVAAGSDTLAVFQGPNAYISPRWYVNGQTSRRVAPSWNYIAIQARGRIEFVDDRDWILAHLAALTHTQEASREQPWSLSDASPQFLQEVSERLIGFTINVTELIGRCMLSQQRTHADRLSLITHLKAEKSGSARDLGALIVP
jgi:transcriptional regulator